MQQPRRVGADVDDRDAHVSPHVSSARTWWGIGWPSSAGEQVVDRQLRHPLAGGPGRRADVRRDDQVRRAASSGSSGGERLGVGDVERGAGDLAGDAAPAASASWSTIGPRAVLIRIAVGFIRASASASIRWWVAGVSGQWSETKSERSSSVLEAPRASRVVGRDAAPSCRTRTPGAATARPIRPKPTIPSVAPWTVGAEEAPGLPGQPVAAARTAAIASGSLRAAASSSANARSAVASVSTSGVLPTGMPRAAAASRSMLS